jgi:hypothetical protein
VLESLSPLLDTHGEVLILAVKQYREYLVDFRLPNNPLDVRVHLTFITDFKTLLERHSVRPQEVEEGLRSFVCVKRPGLRVFITVIGYRDGGFHKDRCIFTNYGFFTSNDSFAFFGRMG